MKESTVTQTLPVSVSVSVSVSLPLFLCLVCLCVWCAGVHTFPKSVTTPRCRSYQSVLCQHALQTLMRDPPFLAESPFPQTAEDVKASRPGGRCQCDGDRVGRRETRKRGGDGGGAETFALLPARTRVSLSCCFNELVCCST